MTYGNTFMKRLTTGIVGLAASLLIGVAMTSVTWANTPVNGAAFTTVNDVVDLADANSPHCLNGNPAVNCNIYTGKQYVWLSGGPSVAGLGAGTYFFAVLSPGGQASPNDGGSNQANGPLANLSDDYDSFSNRTFTIDANGAIAYVGTHDFSDNKIRLLQYADTPNAGGVYILAICSLADNYPVTPSKCKYDAFKVQTSNTPDLPPGLPLTITKSADGSYDNTFAWTIGKAADKTLVKQIGGSVTFTYTVTVTHDAGTIGNVKVTGTITVTNPNVDGSNNTVPVDIDGVTDQLSDGTVCTVTDGGPQTLTEVKTDFAYSCSLGALPQGQIDNNVTVAWPEQLVDINLAAGSADFSFTAIPFAENKVDGCANVTDPIAPGGTLGNVCVGDANPTTFKYTRTVSVPQFGCTSYDNTATFTTSSTGATGSASQTVTVCGPAKTGALTIGFWKGPNGQNLITTFCQAPAVGNLGSYLSGLGGGLGPFSNAPTNSCKDLASYVSGILTAASATDMNKMLKAQMLGTALDVWFSGPGFSSTVVGKIKPPSNFLSHNNLGTFNMDTTAVCPMVDNLSTGTATCKNNTPSTDAFAAGAVPTSPMAMQAILDFAATAPSPFSSGVWYAGNRTKQEILKNIFDQFNNQLAFGSF